MDDHTVVGYAVEISDCVANASGPVPRAVLTCRTGIAGPTVRRIALDRAERGVLEIAEGGCVAVKRLISHGLQSAHRCATSLVAQPCVQYLHLHAGGELAWFATLDRSQLTMTATALGRSRVSMVRSMPSDLSSLGLSRGWYRLANGRSLTNGRPPSASCRRVGRRSLAVR